MNYKAIKDHLIDGKLYSTGHPKLTYITEILPGIPRRNISALSDPSSFSLLRGGLSEIIYGGEANYSLFLEQNQITIKNIIEQKEKEETVTSQYILQRGYSNKLK